MVERFERVHAKRYGAWLIYEYYVAHFETIADFEKQMKYFPNSFKETCLAGYVE